MKMDYEERKELIMRNAEEVIGEDKIISLFKEKEQPVTYCGYETSGEVHLGHLVTITKLMDLEKAGCKVKILFADWHTWLNQKGDWDWIKNQVEMWKKAFIAAGLKNPEFILGTEFQRDMKYIDDLFKLAQKTTLNRALRSMQQVARDIEHAKVSQVIYPLMQILDIKHLGIDIVQAGIEQRKIHMLGLEVFEEILEYKKPVFVHTPLIPALQGPDAGKMSSSDNSTLISVRDDADSIKKKLRKAYCPVGETKENPVIMIAQLIIFPRLNEFIIKRPEKFGGNISFNNFEELKKAYENEEIHPLDLKNAVAEYLIEILNSIRKAFGIE